MPWKEVSTMDQKLEMIRKWNSGMYTKVELAEWSGVSRQTVDKWIIRYQREGVSGLEERSRRPKTSPQSIDEAVAERLLELKRSNMEMGPPKMLAWLKKREPEHDWPVASTIGSLLDRHGLVEKRRKRRRTNRGSMPVVPELLRSGQMMTADYKGEFRLGNGKYCYPLTICDPVSRYVYAVDAHDGTIFKQAKRSFERVFREYGLPTWLKTDNGGPFSSPGLAGISRLSIWWIKLGITPVRIRKSSPWQNGRHERMHKTLKKHTARPPQKNKKAQQERFDRFIRNFNEDRPHEGLDGDFPIEHLERSNRPYPSRIPALLYPDHFEVRKVHPNGQIKLHGQLVFLSEVLVGEYVGLEEIDDDIWSIYFSDFELGRWNVREGVVE